MKNKATTRKETKKPLGFFAHLRVNVKTGYPYFVAPSKKSGIPRWFLVTDRPLRNKSGVWRSTRVRVEPVPQQVNSAQTRVNPKRQPTG